MKLRALKTFCQTAVLATVVCALAACSNPLYGKSDSAQNFHSKNINCNQLDFSKSEAGSKELRSLVHCLNSNHEVEAIETLIGKLKDSDLEPFAELLNHLVHDQPKLLYVMREAYMRAKKSGDLQELQTLLAEVLSKTKVNQALTKILPKYSSALAQYLFNPEVNAQMSGIYSLTHARAYQRLGAEIMDTPMLETLADATHEYLLAQDSIPLSDLYQMLSQHRVDMAWREAMGDDEKSHLQSIATFFEWLFTNGHYQTLSQGIQSVLTEPVRCFKGSTQLENPLASVLLNLSNKSALEAKAYFHHDLQNLYWVAQGYCEIPDAASKLIQLAEEATAIDGFAEVFTVARPLFSDSTFLNFLGSSASASFVKRVSKLAQDHFFQDIFTLITIDLETPISSDGIQLAKLLDSTIKSSTLEDTKVILEFLKPLLNKEAGYGFQFSKLLYKVTLGLPRFKLAL
ncbi:MAG: hypothetical protein H7333_12070, partial [Bdellovibrionales bacterium]|nr:hypothetical protein [Oligoflexia bacterium]